MFPQSKVVSSNTGHNRNYSVYPYGGFRTNSAVLFPLSKEDNRLPPKERVLGVIKGDKVKAYSIENFGSSNRLILDNFEGEKLAIVGNKEKNFIVAFNRELPDGTLLEFQVVQNSGAVILSDQEGNQWDVMGRAVSGPRNGKLNTLPQMMGFWFSWSSFYEVTLYE